MQIYIKIITNVINTIEFRRTNIMVKPIVKDMFFLGQKSVETTPEDKQVAQDLKDTLDAHIDECVGMAANMIGYKKRSIVVFIGLTGVVMHNPVYVNRTGEFEAIEGCLSLTGSRKAKRYREIEVKYQDENFNEKVQKYTGAIAQIIQHEMDHLDGIII